MKHQVSCFLTHDVYLDVSVYRSRVLMV